MRNTMRKIVSLTVALLVLFMAETVLAQGYTFRVLANKGQNKVKRANGQTTALRTGVTLNDGDELITTSGSYVGLLHKSGKTIEIRQPGTRTVTSMAKTVNVGSSSVSARMSKFIDKKMQEKESGSYKARLAATGALKNTRGAEDEITVYLSSQNKNQFLEEHVIVSWEPLADIATYKVEVRNLFDEVVYAAETSETKILLDMASPELANDQNFYIVNVTDKANSDVNSPSVAMKKVTEADAIASLEELKNEIPEETPLSKLIYASFYEENGYLADAVTKYEEAIEMAPDIEDFKQLYENFLLINGLKSFEEEEK